MWPLLAVIALAAGVLSAQPQCQFYLANQTSSNQGFALHLDAPADSKGSCSLNSVTLTLTVGDGAGYRHVTATQALELGVVYTAKAVLNPAGSHSLSLNGRSLGTLTAPFKPALGALQASQGNNAQDASPAYLVRQISLQVANGSTTLSVDPNGNDGVPAPLVLMAGGSPLWQAAFTADPAQALTITASFRFDAAVANPHQYDPYVDTYGQTTATTWPEKVNSDSDLTSAIAEEQNWFAANGPPAGLDQFGGSTVAGWTDRATGYYHTAQHNNRWWLISPLGNPLFYIGIDNMSGLAYTPITGRESMFANLPPQADPFGPAYAQNVWNDARNTTYFSFVAANRIRNYGSGWREYAKTIALQRLAAWGFAGSGKWTDVGFGVTVNPVLNRGGVKPLVPGGHPDVFDSAVRKQLSSALASQITPSATNPSILGWSVGNEKDEIIDSSEIGAILAMGASVAAKTALVDYALHSIYQDSLPALASAWKITASTVADAYAAKPSPPAKDTESLRQYFERSYYSTLYQTVKAIDPNHLYLGGWTQPREHPADWPIMAANCDVVGLDFYAPSFLDPGVQALIQSTMKPVLVGEFSYPSDYGGMRGFGSAKYNGELTLSDSVSGDLYAQWLHDASANPFVVGVEWFEYLDEAITGRGNNDGQSNISSSLVIAESYAFGMVDTTDRPKYDLVNKVRAANIAVLQSLGLLGSAPVLTSSPANAATYLTGGLVPGSWAQVKGTGLSDVPRTWQDSDFTGLAGKLPTDLSGVRVLVNGIPAAVYYISASQVSFQVPAVNLGTANVQVVRDGLVSNTVSASAVSSAPGIFPTILNGTNYAGVFLDGKYVGDPSVSALFRKAKPGDVVELFATGLAPSPSGVQTALTPLSGVTVRIGDVTITADFAGLVGAGDFQINFTVPQQFASRPEGNYPITISVNGVSSPSAINSDPPGPAVLPIQH